MTARVTFVAHTLKCELIALSPAARVENVEIDQISCMSMLYAIASERGARGSVTHKTRDSSEMDLNIAQLLTVTQLHSSCNDFSDEVRGFRQGRVAPYWTFTRFWHFCNVCNHYVCPYLG